MTSLGPLRPGDRVAVLSASGPPAAESFERGIALIESWGLQPVVDADFHTPHPRAKYLAGPDAYRASQLQQAWCDPQIDGIFFARGGYGAVRVLDLLDVDALRAASPKPLYGSSDVTAIHEFWEHRVGEPTWFTPMVATADLFNDQEATRQLREAVFEPFSGREFSSPEALSLVPGHAKGTLTGGNLSLLCMTLGAHNQVKPSNAGKIGLLEDVTEDVYKLDGYLQALMRAGWFEGLSGLALGSWKSCGTLPEVKALCEELLVPLGIPLVWELGFGHGPAAHSIPLGVAAQLIANDNPRLVLN
ncbi:muramoyltetrapeptide carboxypeptidase [Psychromicrobium silvestre]|uniref:Muramoyltetrapeptide carboxypeptidase n=1 Tax=Psychromicrobium silvestre TaxID=1645614 RepID=A0A7Y9LVN5_9MICC|nr:LD-carboxypeptidase [Psychromicrobium silvestre]NYE96421.1 muramoyltetrapeptide carboxypeptidase [Psychromicrobium silvestre]